MAPQHLRISLPDLDPLHIRNVVFEALRHGDAFRADLVDRLLELVDWRRESEANPETMRMLRHLREASDQYELGELSLDGYRDLSVSLFFPTPHRLTRRQRSQRRTDSGG